MVDDGRGTFRLDGPAPLHVRGHDVSARWTRARPLRYFFAYTPVGTPAAAVRSRDLGLRPQPPRRFAGTTTTSVFERMLTLARGRTSRPASHVHPASSAKKKTDPAGAPSPGSGEVAGGAELKTTIAGWTEGLADLRQRIGQLAAANTVISAAEARSRGQQAQQCRRAEEAPVQPMGTHGHRRVRSYGVSPPSTLIDFPDDAAASERRTPPPARLMAGCATEPRRTMLTSSFGSPPWRDDPLRDGP